MVASPSGGGHQQVVQDPAAGGEECVRGRSSTPIPPTSSSSSEVGLGSRQNIAKAIAPGGVLRVGLNTANKLLVKSSTETATGLSFECPCYAL